MPKLPPVLPLSFTSPGLDSVDTLDSPAFSVCVTVYVYVQAAGCFPWSVDPRRLVVAVKDTRTQGHSYVSRATQGIADTFG